MAPDFNIGKATASVLILVDLLPSFFYLLFFIQLNNSMCFNFGKAMASVLILVISGAIYYMSMLLLRK